MKLFLLIKKIQIIEIVQKGWNKTVLISKKNCQILLEGIVLNFLFAIFHTCFWLRNKILYNWHTIILCMSSPLLMILLFIITKLSKYKIKPPKFWIYFLVFFCTFFLYNTLFNEPVHAEIDYDLTHPVDNLLRPGKNTIDLSKLPKVYGNFIEKFQKTLEAQEAHTLFVSTYKYEYILNESFETLTVINKLSVSEGESLHTRMSEIINLVSHRDDTCELKIVENDRVIEVLGVRRGLLENEYYIAEYIFSTKKACFYHYTDYAVHPKYHNAVLLGIYAWIVLVCAVKVYS